MHRFFKQEKTGILILFCYIFPSFFLCILPDTILYKKKKEKEQVLLVCLKGNKDNMQSAAVHKYSWKV